MPEIFWGILVSVVVSVISYTVSTPTDFEIEPLFSPAEAAQ